MRYAPTPAPWVYRSGAIYSPAAGRLALMDRENPNTRPVERDRNARIMAAALDLLALAHRVADHFEGTDSPIGAAARALISQAEGD